MKTGLKDSLIHRLLHVRRDADFSDPMTVLKKSSAYPHGFVRVTLDGDIRTWPSPVETSVEF